MRFFKRETIEQLGLAEIQPGAAFAEVYGYDQLSPAKAELAQCFSICLDAHEHLARFIAKYNTPHYEQQFEKDTALRYDAFQNECTDFPERTMSALQEFRHAYIRIFCREPGLETHQEVLRQAFRSTSQALHLIGTRAHLGDRCPQPTKTTSNSNQAVVIGAIADLEIVIARLAADPSIEE